MTSQKFDRAIRGASTKLPAYLKVRMQRFYSERMEAQWGGRHIMLGRRRAGPEDLQLQSNDYLNIGRHPLIIDAQREALASASDGTMMSAIFFQDPEHPQRLLERELADFLGSEEGILCQSGWCANIGLIQTIASEGVPVYIDKLAHMSLWEGIRAAGAKAVIFQHNNLDNLQQQIGKYGSGIILVDSVYSSNGSLCPLVELIDIAERSDCVMVVDESHALGTHGSNGEGIVVSLGLADKVLFRTASLAKAFVGRAGFIACPADFSTYFGFNSSAAIFSSALLPSDIAGLRAALTVIRSESWRRDRLSAITRQIRQGLTELGYNVSSGSEQIIALEPGPESLTMRLRDVLEAQGVFGSIFCPPATPKNRAMVRLSLHAGLTEFDVAKLLNVCANIRQEVDLKLWTSTK